MSQKKGYVFLGFEFLFLLLCGWGLLENLFQNGTWNMAAFSYYTIQSNLMCFIYFLMSFLWNLIRLCRAKEVRTLSPRLEGAVVFAIAVTMLIFNFILLPIGIVTLGEVHAGDIKAFCQPVNLIPHEFVPLLALMDWCLFVPKGNLKKGDALLWLTLPYAYLIFAMVRARAGAPFADGSRYPYPFLDVDVLGLPVVILAVAVITLVFYGIARLYVVLDGKLGAKRKPAAQRQRENVSA